MKVAVIALLALCAIATSVRADDSHVVSLTEDNFDQVVNNENIIMVEFFAPWCGHCKALAPKYEKAAAELAGSIKLASVDCTSEGALCGRFGVRGYPTVKVFRKGAEPTDYPGARESEAIVSYLRKAAAPAVSLIDAASEETFGNSDRVVVVAAFDAADSAKIAAFDAVANQLREEIMFGRVTDAPAGTARVTLYKKFDERLVQYSGDFTTDDLVQFVNANSVPIMDDVGPQNYQNYVRSGLPIGFLFVSDDSQRASIGAEVEKIAASLKGQMFFVYVDANKYGGFADTLNLKQEWPTFGIQLPERNARYTIDQTVPLTAEAIRQLSEDVLAGTAAPSVKSEPVPEKQDGPVYILVNKNYNEIVNSGKDVFVEFYAPWCGHCKKLAPTYDELGVAFKDNENIVIAKMDATANDLPADAPFQIEGFPTLKLFRADGRIVDYDGGRTLEDLVSFINANAVYGGAEEHEHDHEHDHDHEEL